MKRVILVVTALTLALAAVLIMGTGFSATPVALASIVAGISGPGSSGVQVQNLNATITANISSAFYPQGGGAPVLVTRQIGPDASTNMYLPNIASIPTGAYALVVSSDQPVGAIARTDWANSQGAASYGSVAPATNLRIPLVAKTFAGQTSRIAVQNADTGAAANIRVRIYARGTATPVSDYTDTLPAGNSKTYDLAADANVPNAFYGSAQVESTNGKMLVVATFVDIAGTKAVYAFSGVDVASAATTVYAPLARRDFPHRAANNGPTTGISVANPNGVTVTVVANFYPSPTAGAGGAYSQTKDIGPNNSTVFNQGGGPMPVNWVGSAVLTASGGPILAMVNDRDDFSGTSAAYNAPTAADGAQTVSIPLVRRKHTTSQLTTGVQCMNIGAGLTNITINFKNSTGAPAGTWSQNNIAQFVAPTFYEASASSPFPNGTYGSAKVTSSAQNIVCIVNDASDTGQLDAAVFNGIPIP